MNTFLDSHNLSRLNQDIDDLNRLLTNNEIEAVIKSLPSRKSPGPEGCTTELRKAFRMEVTSIFSKLAHNIEQDRIL